MAIRTTCGLFKNPTTLGDRRSATQKDLGELRDIRKLYENDPVALAAAEKDFWAVLGAAKSYNQGDKIIIPGRGNVPDRTLPVGLGPERSIKGGQVVTLPAIPGGAPMGATAGGQMPAAGPQVEQLPETPAALEKKEGRRLAKLRAGGTVIQDLQRSLGILENDWSKLSAATSGVAKHIPLTDAKALDGLIQSALSNVGIDTLQTMRENSPTGGALGQVPIQQQKRLEQVLGSLDISQEPEIVIQNVKRVINIYKDIAYGTRDEIQSLVEQGKIAPEIAAQAADRYELSFDVFGKPIVNLPPGVTEYDIRATMKANNLTRAQVLNALGVR